MSHLKCRSLDAHTLWVASGGPGHGDIYNNKRCAKAKYKQAIREKDKSAFSNDLNDFVEQRSGWVLEGVAIEVWQVCAE